MTPFRLSRRYRSGSDPNLLEVANFVDEQLTTHTSFFPTPDPTRAALREGIDNFQSAKNAAIDRGRLAVRQKNVMRLALIVLMDQMCNYVVFTAAGDAEIAAKSGFAFTKQPQPRILTVPTGLTITPGNQPGELETSVKRVPAAASYMHQYSTDPELKEESWVSMNCTQAKCLITGLTPGTEYFFRVVAVGSKEQVLTSAVVSRFAPY